MDRNRWKAVNEIFHAALEIPASERREFVCTASKGDPELQSNVDRLLEADERAGSYLESPLLPVEPMADSEASPSPFKPGDVLKHRFRIVRQLGEGGMGHVFEAYDTELKVSVALKAIRPEIAGSSTALEFFRREVTTARTITHPNVCRTFDLDRGPLTEPNGVPREFFFLTMEFLEGETLAARLKRVGPLDPDEGLLIARQIASGLDAAHAVGIVHRDIKPANIMLVGFPGGSGPRIRAVVTDFGLALQDPLHSSMVASSFSHGGTVGTLAYMAPEQLESGCPVSAATDVYAFGLVLFEMITGWRAFPSANLLSGIAQRLAGPQPSPQALLPQIPQVWESVIQCCLRLAPEDRFPSAGQVVEALGGQPIEFLSISRLPLLNSDAPRTRASWSRRSKVFVTAALLVTAVALSAVGLRLYRSETDSRVSPGALVYLTPVKNETGERALDNLTELLQAGLGQSAQINLLDQSRVGDTLQLMTKPPDTVIDGPIAREIAMRTGAVRVVFARVTGSGGKYEMNIDVQQLDNTPSNYRAHWKNSFAWQTGEGSGSNGQIPKDLLTAVRDASNWIRHEAGESRNDIARLDLPPEDVTTDKWDALEEFSEAERQTRAGQLEAAIGNLRNAVKIDPGFSVAYARLGDILIARRQRLEGYRAYMKALNSDSGHRLSRKERDFIQGSYASDMRDYQTALDAFRDYSAFYPNDFTGWLYQAYPLDMLDRPLEAIQALNRAEALTASTHDGAGGLVYNYLLLSDFAAARKWIEVLRSAGYRDQSLYLEGVDLLFEGKYAQAEQPFAALKNSSDSYYRRNGLSGLAATQAEQGKLTAALGSIAESLEAQKGTMNEVDSGQRWLDRAYLLCKSSAWGPCIGAATTALDLDPSPQSIFWAAAIVGGSIPRMPAPIQGQATNCLHRAEALLPREDSGHAFAIAGAEVHGEILLAQHDFSAALKSFRSADVLDAPLTPRDYLAHGLLVAAANAQNAAAARDLKIKALKCYEKTAIRPGIVWRRIVDYPPGFAADQMQSYLALAHELKDESDETQRIASLYSALRP
jgi:serine/threonine protein kinase/predicted negative regulator of RcsB-dependent stress response